MQMDQVTQQNAALVEESAAAASSMKDQAHRLAEVVSTFKLDNQSIVVKTAPSSIANAIYQAATHPKGKLHIVSGGDAKLYAFMKALLPERAFQKMQIRTMLQPLSAAEIAFAKWLFGSNLAKLEIGKSKN